MASPRLNKKNPVGLEINEVKVHKQEAPSSNTKLQEVQLQVDQITSIMRENVRKIMEREAKLEQLQETSERLQNSAGNFQKVAQRVKKMMWWKDTKMRIIIGSLVAVVILGLIIWLSVTFTKKKT